MTPDTAPRPQPILNLPAITTAMILLLAGVHMLRWLVLSPRADVGLLASMAFIPLRYDPQAPEGFFPGGDGALWWSPFSYALLHADAMHLVVNAAFLAAFGAMLAWRLAALRFVVFTAGAAGAGALAHYLAMPDDIAPVIGASAVVSGAMGAVLRFMFAARRAMAQARAAGHSDRASRLGALLAPGEGLPAAFRDRRILGFVLVWMVLNWAVGSGVLPLFGDAGIAWQAHVGGFVFGFLTFGLFDRSEAVRLAEARTIIQA